MSFPRQIQDLIDAFLRLPGIGPKTAERLAFYLLHVPSSEIVKFSEAISNLHEGLVLCDECKNISSGDKCEICTDTSRDKSVICVVESPLDVYSLEKADGFRGVYHVLHGLINPLANIGPDEIYIESLINRVGDNKDKINEIIIALNPTMEGEATTLFIKNKLKAVNGDLKITRLGVGLPIGGDMQYADATTLSRALEGRRSFE